MFNHLCMDCRRPATQASTGLCDSCWVQKYSTQYIGGQHVPYVEFFRMGLGEMAKKPDETREEWFTRCEDHVRKDESILG